MKKLFLCLFSVFQLNALDITITIDDYPMPDGLIFSAEKRTQRFIEICEKHLCKAAFFCIGNNCKDENLLLQLDKNGHFLCNHSMNHFHLSSQNLEEFEAEVIQVDNILSSYQNFRKWYRYPYLDYGNRIAIGGSDNKAFLSLQLLKRLGHIEGYVTINTFDWHINDRLTQAIKNGCIVNYDELKKVYILLLKSWCDYYLNFYDKMSLEPFTHTLLLHANDLNALFLNEILEMINDSGWHIVSPEKAFSDLSWRNNILKNLDIITHKPQNLDCKEIDKLLIQNEVFTFP